MAQHLDLPNGAPDGRGGSALRGRTYTPGFSDELGVRRVAHGAPGEPPLEVLEFAPELADSPGFERALRARVDALRDVNQLSLATAFAVERPDGRGLCLVSEHVAGRRLSELGPEEWGGALALDLIHTVTPVLEALNQSGVGIAHGALSANRIVVATDSRLVVVEHVLGWAIESPRFSRARLNGLGIAVASGFDPVRFDGRTDMTQLGFLALSLWLRRPLDPADCPVKAPEFLDEAVGGDDPPLFAPKLRAWLERALQIGPEPFTSPQDGLDAFGELPGELPWSLGSLETSWSGSSDPALSSTPEPKWSPGSLDQGNNDDAGSETPALHADFNVAQLRAAIEHRHATPESSAAPARRFSRTTMWVLAVLALIAVGEAVAVGWVAYGRSVGARLLADASTPDQQASPVATTPAASTPVPANEPVTPSPVPPPVVPAPAPAPPSPRVGRLTIAAAVELRVFEGGTPIGSNARPLALREGTHTLELVNESLGFRQTQEVNVRNAQMSTLRVTMPDARISLNATPWAEVMIDGEAVGETPIASLSVPAGVHEIVFRHPELGERRQTVVIKVGAHMRVTQAFDREPRGGAR